MTRSERARSSEVGAWRPERCSASICIRERGKPAATNRRRGSLRPERRGGRRLRRPSLATGSDLPPLRPARRAGALPPARSSPAPARPVSAPRVPDDRVGRCPRLPGEAGGARRSPVRPGTAPADDRHAAGRPLAGDRPEIPADTELTDGQAAERPEDNAERRADRKLVDLTQRLAPRPGAGRRRDLPRSRRGDHPTAPGTGGVWRFCTGSDGILALFDAESIAKTVTRFGTSRCVHGTFWAAVSGLLIRRVVFSLGTRVIATRGSSPFMAMVVAVSGIDTLTARVTFTDNTPPATLRMRFRSCAAARRSIHRPHSPSRRPRRPGGFTG